MAAERWGKREASGRREADLPRIRQREFVAPDSLNRKQAVMTAPWNFRGHSIA
jgi:hypothetical protein